MENIQLIIASEKDIPDLTRVMTSAFDDDACMHLDEDKGGPPGYDDGEFFRKWMLGYDESIGYKIIAENIVIGGCIVWVLPTGENFLGTMFVDPAFQNKGVGTQTWQFIEATYPDTKSWTLGTPKWAVRNHYFYENKCGFTKVGEQLDEEEGMMVYMYKKEIEQPKAT